MRKRTAIHSYLVASLALVLGFVPAADAGISSGSCCACNCGDEIAFCVEGPADGEVFQAACEQSCGGDPDIGICVAASQSGAETSGPVADLCDLLDECDGVPRGIPSSEQTAPAVSWYGLAALFAALSSVGVWRMRKPAGAS